MSIFNWKFRIEKPSPPLTPESVLDMSQKELEGLRERMAVAEQDMVDIRRNIEAIRKKVYRDSKGNGEGNAELAEVFKQPEPVAFNPATIRTGDPANLEGG
jgi:hypothetical protein